MGRIARAFAQAKRENRAALVIYLCAGDPDLATTGRLVKAIARAGADIVELGVPFSDPTADGPVIQRASERALASGTTLQGALDVVAELRASSEVAVILFGYYNPILAYGEDALAREAARAGVDGFLVVDLPPEEAGGFVTRLHKHALDFIPLVAPTTSNERLVAVRQVATSFIYYVSLTGVTGAAAVDLGQVSERAAEVAAATGLPVAVGFGIKTPQDVRAVVDRADGAVVGSAVCSAIELATNADAAVQAVSALVSSLRAATIRRTSSA
jgi:tryptophan synthase alpha chain